MIYFDNASTTKPSQVAIDAVNDVLINHWGNPSSIHDMGTDAASILEWSRKVIADSIGAEPEEIIFTSGASESNNLAMNGIVIYKPTYYISSIEHPSIAEDFYDDEANDVISCYKDGTIKIGINSSIDGDDLVYISDIDNEECNMELRKPSLSIGFANNEIGTIQDVKDISNIIHSYANEYGNGAFLHVDATQAYGHLPINVKELGIDMMSVSGHKLNAPKGIGFLYVKKGIKLIPQIVGGHQEHGLRAGTENVAFAYALAKVVEQEYSPKQIECNRIYVEELTKYLYDKILDRCSNLCKITLNGVQDLTSGKRLAGNLSLTFEGVSNESLVLLLNMKGFAISSGSACSSGDLKPSRILKAIGLSDEEANSTVRISLCKDNNFEEADAFVDALEDILKTLLGK